MAVVVVAVRGCLEGLVEVTLLLLMLLLLLELLGGSRRFVTCRWESDSEGGSEGGPSGSSWGG